jgi:thioester reductase-like protein
MKVALTGAAGFIGTRRAFSLLMIPPLQAAGRWINTGQTYG